MRISCSRSKLPILIKFLSYQCGPASNFHHGFNLVPRNCASPVRVFKHMNTPLLVGVRFYYGNRTTLPCKSVWAIVLSYELGTGIPLRNWKREYIYAGLAFLAIVLFGRLEKVPYSERYHLVLSCEMLDWFMGKLVLKMLRTKFRGSKLISPDDEESIRVHSILEDIVDGMNADLMLKKEGSVVFADKWISDHGEGKKVEKVSDRKITDYSRERRVGKYGRLFGTKHLEGLKWEVRVLDIDTVNACYTSRGKIVVFSGLLKKLIKSDEELAFVLAHEVGHGVAQHMSENVMILLWDLTRALLYPLPNFIELREVIFCYLSRRREMEADYIGLMLMASAGYDPRAAPELFEKMAAYESKRLGIYATHPKGKKRAENLRKPEVMDRAVEIYREATFGHSDESFV